MVRHFIASETSFFQDCSFTLGKICKKETVMEITALTAALYPWAFQSFTRKMSFTLQSHAMFDADPGNPWHTIHLQTWQLTQVCQLHQKYHTIGLGINTKMKHRLKLDFSLVPSVFKHVIDKDCFIRDALILTVMFFHSGCSLSQGWLIPLARTDLSFSRDSWQRVIAKCRESTAVGVMYPSSSQSHSR